MATALDSLNISAKVQEFLSAGVSEEDIAAVENQLGRYPRGMVAVGSRCVCGQPLTTVTRPLVNGKIPFPTTFYLCNPVATKAVSRVEAAGDMAVFSTMVGQDTNVPEVRAAYKKAHEIYLEFRHELAVALGDGEEHIQNISAGGMPERVKCLHALVGQSLSLGRGINPIGDMVLDQIKDEFDPTVCRCSVASNSSIKENTL